MKKLFVLAVCVLFLASCDGEMESTLVGAVEAGATEAGEVEAGEIEAELLLLEPEADLLRVVATVFPQYDFVRRVGGSRVDLTMLITPGAESHAFEPTPRDMVTISEADLFIHVGGHKDMWVPQVMEAIGNDDIRVTPLMALGGELLEELHEPCDCCGIEYEEGVARYDVHVWTCPRQVILIAGNLADILSEMDPANAYYFRNNADEFITELQELDAAFVEVVENGVRNTIVIGDRFPLRYFVHTYDLRTIAAFQGCCVDTSVAPATVASIIRFVQNEEIPVVFYMELSNKLTAGIIQEATGVELLEFHSMHNLCNDDFRAGITYMDIMRQNIIHLREALS